MPCLPIGPANNTPPLRCERLEDRSLLSATMLSSVLGDSVLFEQMPGQELPVEGVVLEIGGIVVPIDLGTIRTAEWSADRDGFLTEEEYWADTWYCEDEYWDGSETYVEYADEWYYEDDPYYEDEYWDDSWYLEEEVYFDDSWYYEGETSYEEDWYYGDELDFEVEFLDSGGMTWEEYEEAWLDWDRSIDLVLTPADVAGDWIVTADAWTTLDDGMVYAMAVSGGIAILEAPLAAKDTPIVDLLPLAVTTPDTDSAAELAPALPPAAADLATPPDITSLQEAENTEAATVSTPEPAEIEEAAPPTIAALSDPDDHLTDGESLELNEDLRVG